MWASGTDPGIPGWFVALFLLGLVAAVGGTVWKIMVARDLAREAGMDPGRATGATLLSERGWDTHYLAASLRSTARPHEPRATPAERLRTIDRLRDQGLIDDAEHAERRNAILDSL